MNIDEWHLFDDSMRLFILVLIGFGVAMLCGIMNGMNDVMHMV